MPTCFDLIERSILPHVKKPARYIGGEINASKKGFSPDRVNICLAFPDIYEIGMSHLGLKILYNIINGKDCFSAERVFCPWTDMEKELRDNSIPLFSLENKVQLKDFDVIGFSLQYELCMSNVLTMLGLAGIPFKSEDRGSEFPLVIAGGSSVCQPEPFVKFFDVIVLGDGEYVILEFLEWIKRERKLLKEDKAKALEKLASEIESAYVPSLAKPPRQARRRKLRVLESCASDEKLIVPHIQSVHNRVVIEIMRGCSRGCRFCQPGMIGRPVVEKPAKGIIEEAVRKIEDTGFEEVSLLSLSAGDYSGIKELIGELVSVFDKKSISVGLPSLRADTFCIDLASFVRKVRKTGITFAPEAGNERLRKIINKDLTDREIIEAAGYAFSKGWNLIKLYFMVGLPQETDEDVLSIGSLIEKIIEVAKQNKKGRMSVNVTISNFVPKAHTPFQWENMNSIDELRRKHRLVRNSVGYKKLKISCHDPEMSYLESVFARGGKPLADVILKAWEKGARFDQWNDIFDFGIWKSSFDETGIDMSNLSCKPGDKLPWSHIDYGVKQGFLITERQKALRGEMTPDCRISKECTGCGACD